MEFAQRLISTRRGSLYVAVGAALLAGIPEDPAAYDPATFGEGVRPPTTRRRRVCSHS